ncbi:MAG: hypothetical protein GX221_04640 [Candidatus Riflebacteria bacterium]|nr:hypothetical protein [Candidatus Riflebacteria bacterium]
MIEEIEVAGTSLNVKCLTFSTDSPQDTLKELYEHCPAFDPAREIAGFHDCDFNDRIVRGAYSVVIPFEVEHLVDTITTKTLFKRIETCEFVITPVFTAVYGKNSAARLFIQAVTSMAGVNAGLREFQFEDLDRLQERMTIIKTVVLVNPKDKEISRARLSGHMESYTEYNIIDPQNHDIDSISGVIETPLGTMGIAVGKKGNFRLSVKKDFIMTAECLEWIYALITEERLPEIKSIRDAEFHV